MFQLCLHKLWAFGLAPEYCCRFFGFWCLAGGRWVLTLFNRLWIASSIFFPPPEFWFLGASYKWDYFLYFFTACFCVEIDEQKARSYLWSSIMQVGKNISVGLPEASFYTSIVISPKTLHCNFAEGHPQCFRDVASGLKWFLSPFQKTSVPGSEI